MNNKNYHASFIVDQPAEEVFNTVNNVSKWWTKNMEGQSAKLNDIFTVHFGETFIQIKIIAFVPYSTIRWEVIDCYKHWLKDKKEWKGTTMAWDISEEASGTKLSFTHIGLVPGIECYEGCENAWNGYIKGTLFQLLTNGKKVPALN